MRNEDVEEKIKAHHSAMVAELNGRVEALGQAVRSGTDWRERVRSVAEYLSEEVMPHAQAEETTLYQAAAHKLEAKLLVDAMIGEHRLIRSRIERLGAPLDGLDAYAEARIAAALFEDHAQKENDRLLPLLTRDPEVRLEALLEGMHEHLAPDASSEDVELDVREISHAQRHTVIFGLFERLKRGQALVLTVDHDPLPLRYQLSALHPDGLGWDYRERGPVVWRVALRKRSAAKD